MAEIVCISCWKGFELQAPEDGSQEEEVTCPECGFVQPARPEDGTPGSAAETGTESAVDPFDELAEEVVLEGADGPDEPARRPTADFAAADLAGESEAQDEAPSEPADPPESEPQAAEPKPPAPSEDTRWRFRSSSGLELFFPAYELAAKWALNQTGSELMIACGPGPYRSFVAFRDALAKTRDPIEALASVAPETASDPSRAVAQEARPPAAGKDTPDAQLESRGKPRKPARTTTMTSEFTFRTGAEDSGVWPARLLFLGAGLLVGACCVYYAAWLGILPGIFY